MEKKKRKKKDIEGEREEWKERKCDSKVKSGGEYARERDEEDGEEKEMKTESGSVAGSRRRTKRRRGGSGRRGR